MGGYKVLKARITPVRLTGYTPKAREVDGELQRASRQQYRAYLKKKRRKKDASGDRNN